MFYAFEKLHFFLMRFIYIVFQRSNIFHYIVIVEVWKLEYKLGSLSLMFLPKLVIIIKEKNKYHLTTSFLRTSVHQLKSPVNYFPLVNFFHFLQRNPSAKAFWKQVICLLMKSQLRNNTLKVSWSQLIERKKKHTYFCLLDETNNKPPKNYINAQLIFSRRNLKTNKQKYINS